MTSVADPERFDSDPDPTYQADADRVVEPFHFGRLQLVKTAAPAPLATIFAEKKVFLKFHT